MTAPLVSKRCLYCGAPMTVRTTSRSLYCSGRCRFLAFHERHRRVTEVNRWDWLEAHPGVLGELAGFGLILVLVMGTSLGLVSRRGAVRGLRILLASQEVPPLPAPAPGPPRPRTPLYLLRPDALGRFWEA